jgi:hypothetical protein
VLLESNLRRFPTSNWKTKDVAFMINSLHEVKNTDTGVNEFLVLMMSIINDSLLNSRTNRISAQDVSMILYGLRAMRSGGSELDALLEVLALIIKECTEIFNGQAIGNSLLIL